MEPNQIAGAGSQIWKRKARTTDRAGSSQPGQRSLLRRSLRLRVAAVAQGFWSVANGLWLPSAVEPGLDLEVHPRRAARLLAQDRKVAPTAAIIDSQSVKTPDQAGPRGYDAGKKIKGRKRHIAVDCLGLILTVMITAASVQDRDAARSLIKSLVTLYGRVQIIWADGGYLGPLVQWVKQLRPFGRLRLEIVRRGDRAKGFKVLPKRWIVERTFGWFTKSRRLCRDYEVRLDHSEAMIRICMIRIMVRRLAKNA